MLLSFPCTINNSEEMLVLSGYFVCADKAKEQSGPEQSNFSTSMSLEKLGRKGAEGGR